MLPRRSLCRVALALALLLALCVSRSALAVTAPTHVYVLTMGAGDHPFTRFGHNALFFEWEGATTQTAVYNFGTFEFDGLHGVEDFMDGRFRYWLSVGSLEGTLRAYQAERRSLTAQELALTSAERAELYRSLVDNALPQHRYYDYDYYRDNCSTRVRDALDRVLGGDLRRQVVGTGRLTFRQHTLRLVGDTPWLYFGLDVALGTPTDRPITRWQELFLPQELHDELAHATRQLGARRVPLVRAERPLLSAERPPLPRDPPRRSLALATLGGGCGLLLAGLGWLAARGRALRALFGVALALLGTALGLLGTALLVFSLSKHWAAHGNLSLLACQPWALALGVVGLGFAFRRAPRSERLLFLLWCSVGATGLLFALALFTGNHESLRLVALFLPLWTGALSGAVLSTRRVVT